MKISDTHVCSFCGKNNDWEYHIQNRMTDSSFDAEDFIESKTHVKLMNSKMSPIYEFSYMCKQCEHENMFRVNNPRVK